MTLIELVEKYSVTAMMISGACLVVFEVFYFIKMILLVALGLSLVVFAVSIYAKFFMKKHLKKLERDFK